jgi:hypothetical protein
MIVWRKDVNCGVETCQQNDQPNEETNDPNDQTTQSKVNTETTLSHHFLSCFGSSGMTLTFR